MSQHSLRRRIESLGPWFHNLELDGIQTAPEHFLGDYPSVKLAGFVHALPENMAGKSVLDIGCNAGFYSFEMLRRGAERVVAIDSDERYLAQARLAAEVLGHRLELRLLSAYDVEKLGERFDFVIFMGVLYHLRHPLLALDRIRAHVARDELLFQSMLRGSHRIMQPELDYPFERTDIFEESDFPRMAFIEHAYAHDRTNWWVPNRACAEAMLRSAGFRITAHPEPEVYLCKVAIV
jgi:tRNA (mo5U34)-methyltransferase